MKVAIAQIDTTVGDIRGNVERILGAYGRAKDQGADLVLTPEMGITGYPPRDLLDQPDFVAANLEAFAGLARKVSGPGLVVGYADVNRRRWGKPLHNAVALLSEGKVVAKRFKSLLPTYDVFDEARHFQPASGNAPVPFRGKRLGLTVCEDAWNDERSLRRRRYAVDPLRRQVQAGADLLINISASPFEKGKIRFRRELMERHAASLKVPFLYCNQVGGNDELVFDGNSFALDGRGGLIRQAAAFAEDLILVDPEASVPDARWTEQGDVEQIYHALILGIRDYARKCGFSDAVIGLSGGIDSAVVCALAADALGPDHVTGVAMPSMYSSPGSVTDAQDLARNLGVRLYMIPITDLYDGMLRSLSEAFRGTKPGLAEQNIQARIRGNLLMALSNKTGALLFSTGNKSELSMGYCTLYGDMSGGLAVIGDVVKTTVYALARWINRDGERIPQPSIDKPPSAELAPGQKDQDDLPPYETLDPILEAYIEQGLDAASIAVSGAPIALVRRILSRVDLAEYKRVQAPPALRISPKAFGIGRQMPIARGQHR